MAVGIGYRQTVLDDGELRVEGPTFLGSDLCIKSKGTVDDCMMGWMGSDNDADIRLRPTDTTKSTNIVGSNDGNLYLVTELNSTSVNIVNQANGLGRLIVQDRVGIGTNNPDMGHLHVEGGNSTSIYGFSTGTPGNPGYPEAPAIHGETSGNYAYGVRGTATGTSGGVGVHGISSNYIGVMGESDYWGVYGKATDWGTGVRGYATDNGVGVAGQSVNNHGVRGSSGASDFSKAGVYGSGTNGAIGVYGSSSDSFGVKGEGDQIGIWGDGDLVGVWGEGNTFDFYAGRTGLYGGFTGGHEVKLTLDFPKEVEVGMLVSSTGLTQMRENSISSTLLMVRLSHIPKDTAVLGVFVAESPLPEEHWYEAKEGERFAIINAVGEGRMLVTDINGEVKNGDYITTSQITGYGQRQNDDLLHSYTAAKATESVDWDKVSDTIEYNGKIYKKYLIAVTYHSG